MARFYTGPVGSWLNNALPTDEEVVVHALAYATLEVAKLDALVRPFKGCSRFARIAFDVYEFEAHVRDIVMHFNLFVSDVKLGRAVTRLMRDQMKYLVNLLYDAEDTLFSLLDYGGFAVVQSK